VPTSDGGPTSVARDFWCIAHDDRAHKPRLPEAIIGLGLAAGLLVDLLLSGHVHIGVPPHPESAAVAEVEVADAEVEVQYVSPPSDPLSRDVFEVLWQHEEDRHLTTWVQYLGKTAYRDVAARLVEENIIKVVHRSRLFGLLGTVSTYGSKDARSSNLVAWPGIRLANMLRAQPNPADLEYLRDLMCAGLCEATGLVGHVLWDGPLDAEAKQAFPLHLERLPSVAALLLSCVESAVAEAVLVGR
jgi:hypothetical protein